MTQASLRNKLLLVFFGITAVAFSVIYFVVVPQLESTLRDQQLSDLKRGATSTAPRFSAMIGRDVPAPVVDRRVRAAAEATDSRVTLLSIQQSLVGPRGRVRFFVLSDSGEEREVPSEPVIARRAVEKRRITTGFGTVNGDKVGQVAQPIDYRGTPAWVALYSRPLGDVAETVSSVRERVLVATGIALLIALTGGYLVAQALARRVKRLETSVKEVAAGRFQDPLPVDSDDELGQLTRAFNEMQEQLRQVDVARKEFIATASHELRTPIFSLAGFVELLQDEDLDDETRREFLETMNEQVARLQKLSVDLLDLSRLDAGSLEVEREPVDLSELARSVLGEFTPALGEHGTDLDVELPLDGVEASCDAERVAQIMRILLDNALRHTPEGTNVTVSAERQNGAAELTVADNGPGVGESAASHVFERFYTGDATRGAGLGLAIAQELAERMQGRIKLDSRAGATSFTLELPSPGGDWT
ncbi:MAG TPA: HAMP domain-containing sensor histidine kinase [Thermoleophilaceae bacterium]|jgi:signal transduction histidine kinase